MWQGLLTNMGRNRNFGFATGIQMRSQSKRRFSLRYQKLISKHKTHVPTQINYYCSKQGQGLRLVFTKTVQSPRATYRVESMGTSQQIKFVKTSNLTHAGKRDGYLICWALIWSTLCRTMWSVSHVMGLLMLVVCQYPFWVRSVGKVWPPRFRFSVGAVTNWLYKSPWCQCQSWKVAARWCT